MLEWLKDVFRKPERPPLPTPPDSDLSEARLEHVRLLSRADRAIHEAMRHADEAFYVGPDRRKHPR